MYERKSQKICEWQRSSLWWSMDCDAKISNPKKRAKWVFCSWWNRRRMIGHTTPHTHSISRFLKSFPPLYHYTTQISNKVSQWIMGAFPWPTLRKPSRLEIFVFFSVEAIRIRLPCNPCIVRARTARHQRTINGLTPHQQCTHGILPLSGSEWA